MNKLQQMLDEKGTLILDGAMGTMLFDAGMPSGHPPEDWNVTNPEAVKAVHQQYVDAGSDVFLTNTFGGTCLLYTSPSPRDLSTSRMPSSA